MSLTVVNPMQMALMTNMLTMVARSSDSLEEEIVKTGITFRTFMERTEGVVAALTEENAALKAELIAEKTRMETLEHLHCAEKDASAQVISELRQGINQLRQDMTHMKQQMADLTTRYQSHQHTTSFFTGRVNASLTSSTPL